MRFKNILFTSLLAGVALLSGCASIQPTRFVSDVDSLSQTDAVAKKRYVLMPGGKGVDAGDLQFQEFARPSQDLLQVDATRQRTLAGALNHRAVGHGIGKRNAELQHVGTGLHQSVQQRHGGLGRGVARSDVGNQGLATSLGEALERGGDAAHAAAP